MSAGTGELESDSEEGLVRAPITVTCLETVASVDPNHPPNYPVQSIIIHTSTVCILVNVAGYTLPLSDQALLTFARELINATPR